MNIVALFWAREELAIQETTRKYHRYLSTIAYNILSDTEDSRESVNDTYLRAWQSMPPHRPCVLSAYLGKITRQTAIDLYRKKKARKRLGSQYQLSLSDLRECIPDRSSDTVSLPALTDSINAYLHTLAPDARRLFLCRYFYMDSLKQAAAFCGMSESKAKSLLYRTRIGLRVHLEKEGYII